MGLLTKAFSPLTNAPSRVGKKVSDMISPADQEGSALRGFLSGAAEGAGDLVSGMTSPFSLATMAAGPTAGMLGRAFKGGGNIARAAAPTLDLVEAMPTKQMAPAMDDISALIGDLHRNLARVPTGGRPAPAAMALPEYAAVGNEAAVNAPRILNSQRFAQGIDNTADMASQMVGKRRPFLNVPRDPRAIQRSAMAR